MSRLGGTTGRHSAGLRMARAGAAAALLGAGLVGGLLPASASATSAARPGSRAAACDTTWVPKAGSVIVFPQPGARLASPKTQLTFRGIAPGKIGRITVVGSRSGSHTGTWKADSDGRGASFYPSRPFIPGETVTVQTRLSIVNGRHGRWAFTVSQPVSNVPPDPVRYTTSGPGVHEYRTTRIRPPVITVATTPGATAARGDLFLAAKPSGGPGTGQPGPMILTPSGRLVWFRALGGAAEAFNFRSQTYRGHPVLTWFQGRTTGGHGSGYDVIDNAKYQTIATVHAGNGFMADLHEFRLTPENTALVTAYQPVRFSSGSYHGVVQDGIVQEIDIPTGNVLFEWHALDHVRLRSSYIRESTSYYDYFHVNSADLDSRDDGILISARNTDAEYFVSRYTGAIQWELGGKRSTMGKAVRTVGQHDARWLSPTRITIFDDGAGIAPGPEPHSRGLVVDLDCAKHRAAVAAAYIAPGAASTSMGSMQQLANGDAMVGLGQEPKFYELSPSSQPVLTGELPGYDRSYRVYDLPWTGYPTTRPAVTAASTGGTLTVYVSWNGATRVARWRLRGGATATPRRWTHHAAVAHTDYVDHITPPWTARYVQVQALDRTGRVIGSSAVTKVSS